VPPGNASGNEGLDLPIRRLLLIVLGACLVWATGVSSLDFARDAALIALAAAHDAVIRVYDSRLPTRDSSANHDFAERGLSRESEQVPGRRDLAARGGPVATSSQNEVNSEAETRGGSALEFDPRDLLFLQDVIDRNRLTEASSSFDSDNGNGILEPLELGRQVWRRARLVEFRTGPDPYGAFGYAIHTLPESVGNLDMLEVLDLNSNSLTALPEALGSLRNLRELRLFRNGLIRLPEDVGGLLRLRVLVLSSNDLTELPESFADLGQLEELYLRNNPLTMLPANLAKLDQLQILDLTRPYTPQALESAGSDFRAASIVAESASTPSLPFALMPDRETASTPGLGMRFTSLPTALAQLSRLQELHLGGNSLYCARGSPTPEAFPSFLRDGSIPHVYGLMVQECP